jgi:hypothetical protein
VRGGDQYVDGGRDASPIAALTASWIVPRAALSTSDESFGEAITSRSSPRSRTRSRSEHRRIRVCVDDAVSNETEMSQKNLTFAKG